MRMTLTDLFMSHLRAQSKENKKKEEQKLVNSN